mgnify:CR=1 FL=1
MAGKKPGGEGGIKNLLVQHVEKMALGVAVVLARTDRRMRSREQVEEVLGMSAHVTIPAVDDHEVAAHIVETLVALDRRDEALEVLVDAESRHADSDLLQDVRDRFFPDAD